MTWVLIAAIVVLLLGAVWLQVRYVRGFREAGINVPRSVIVVRTVNMGLLVTAIVLVLGYMLLRR